MLILTQPIYKTNFTIDVKRSLFTRSRVWENKYADFLTLVANRVESILGRVLKDFDFHTGIAAMDALQKYSQSLIDWANKVAGRVVYSVNREEEAKWSRHSRIMSYELKRSLQQAPIDGLLQQYVAENVALIQSMPLESAKRVYNLLMDAHLKGGRRAESLVDEIAEIGQINRNRAKLIARTETSKIATGVTRARSLAIGSEWYYWRSAKDGRVRPSHERMDDCLIHWSEPPSPELVIGQKSYGNYHAGSTFNCRCYPEPVLGLADIAFPAKIFWQGKIMRMSRARFLTIAESQIPSSYQH